VIVNFALISENDLLVVLKHVSLTFCQATKIILSARNMEYGYVGWEYELDLRGRYKDWGF
jgi:hypothetical protein